MRRGTQDHSEKTSAQVAAVSVIIVVCTGNRPDAIDAIGSIGSIRFATRSAAQDIPETWGLSGYHIHRQTEGMRAWAVALSVVLLVGPTVVGWRLSCHLHDQLGSLPDTKQRFLVLGTNDHHAAGLGNVLSFFPAAFYFAQFTNRQIVVHDKSLLGRFCRLVNCPFPSVQQMALVYPSIFTEYNVYHQRIVTARDFRAIFDAKQPMPTDDMVTSTGIDGKSDWWLNFRNLSHCVVKLSGCTLGDITCSERFALQTLVPGPFDDGAAAVVRSSIRGLTDGHLSSLFQLPHEYAPRFDVAVHIRNQFKTFESGNYSAVDEEATRWLETADAQEYCDKLLTHMQTFLDKAQASRKQPLHDAWNGSLAVYVTADNSVVKAHVAQLLQQRLTQYPTLFVMMANATVSHVKHGSVADAASSFTRAVFDWYALSLSNVVITYRKELKGASTFVWSAARVSGTRDRTNFEVGASVGTQAFQFHRDRGGRAALGRIWHFANFDLD